MGKTSTSYTVQAVNGDEVTDIATKSVKAKAIELATAHRDENKVGVRVVTQSGTVVHEAAAPKKIKMSPRFTRVVELPENVEIPEGFVARYVRPRAAGGLVVLHEQGEGIEKPYALLSLKTGKVRGSRFATTRQAGAEMSRLAADAKAKLAQAETQVEATPEPANA